MSFLSRRPAFLSFGASVAIYAAGAVLTGLIVAHAVHRVGIAVLEGLVPAVEAPRHRLAEIPPPPTLAAAPIVRREAAMTLLNDRWAGRSRPGGPRLAAGPQFGGSSRNASRWSERRPWGFGDDDDDDRPAVGGTYRTVCVRLCDGYYFPVSFSVTADRLGRDRQVCVSRCGAQGRLFVHRNPGGSAEDMEDLDGRPYRQLRTAFLYRSEYVPTCTCQPQPWETASLERHRTYALALAARNGSKDAAKELQALQAKARQIAKAPDPATAGLPPNAVGAASSSKEPALASRDSEGIMRLGGDDAPKARPPERSQPSSQPAPDWFRRAFGAGTGG